MSEYKNQNLKLVTEENVDVIYSSKESSILEMDKCAGETELVRGKSSFFGQNLSFINLILGYNVSSLSKSF